MAGFYVGSPEKVQAKLHRFAQAGPDSTYYLFDFDNTLTTSKHTGEDVSTWTLLHGLLPENGKTEIARLRNKYLPMEIAGSMTEKDALTWWDSALALYIKYPVYMKDIEAASKNVRLRDGTTRLFKSCEAADIPTVILSAGISNVIDSIVARHDIHPSLILSTEFVLGEDGRVLNWDRGSMIHILNKRERGHTELSRIRSERPYTILVGDALQDVDMVDGDEHVLRVRMCDLVHQDPAKRDSYLEQSFAAGFDMVLEEDLEPLILLNQWLVQR